MRYRNASEQAAHRHAIEEIVDRWVDGEFDVPGDPKAAINTKRKLIMEEHEFFHGKERRMPDLPDETSFWWQERESA